MSKGTKQAVKATKATTKATAAKPSKPTTAASSPKASAKPTEAYRAGSNYAALVSVLAANIGKFVELSEIEKQLAKWEGFRDFCKAKKRNKNGKAALGQNGKVRQNLDVLRRVDYGEPLRATKHEIRRSENGEYGLFRMK